MRAVLLIGWFLIAVETVAFMAGLPLIGAVALLFVSCLLVGVRR